MTKGYGTLTVYIRLWKSAPSQDPLDYVGQSCNE